jgi:hypothetical protein
MGIIVSLLERKLNAPKTPSRIKKYNFLFSEFNSFTKRYKNKEKKNNARGVSTPCLEIKKTRGLETHIKRNNKEIKLFRIVFFIIKYPITPEPMIKQCISK